MAENFEGLASLIRSVIVTSKTPLTVFEVNRDFKQVEDEDIPYRQHQCRTLEELLRKIPDVRVFQQAGRTVVQAIPNEKNAHIVKMVRAQRPPKKKPSRSMNFNRYGNRRPPSYNNYNYPRTDVNRNNVQNKYSYQDIQYRVNTSNSFTSRPNLAEVARKPELQASSALTTQRSSDRPSPSSSWSPVAARRPTAVQSTTSAGTAARSPPVVQSTTSAGTAPRSPPSKWSPVASRKPAAVQPTASTGPAARSPPVAVQQPARASVAAQPVTEPPMWQSKEASPTYQRPITPTTSVTPRSATVQQRLGVKSDVPKAAPQNLKIDAVRAVQTPVLQQPASPVEAAVPKPLSQQQPLSARPTVQQRLNVTWTDQEPDVTTSSIQRRLNISSPAPVESKPQHPSQSNVTSVPSRTPAPAQRLTAALNPQSRISMVQDPRLRLHNYAESKNLPPPLYKEVPTKSGKFLCSVNVNSKKYSSYPNEAKTAEEAEKLAAQAALDALTKEGESLRSTTWDRNLLTRRILLIVAEHPNGIFEKNVQEFYVEKYNEQLPSGWLKIIENEVMIDSGANHLPILSPRITATLKRPSRPPSPRIVDPEPLRLSHLTEFAVHIYAAYSTTEIWGVIIDSEHSDQIYELADQMEQHYTGDITAATDITSGKHYAVFEEAWHRVRCVHCDSETQMATVFFIDRGDEDTYDFSKLRPLLPEFCQLPAQAVRLSLDGLEIFEGFDEIQAILDDSLVEHHVSVMKVSEGQYSNMISAQLYLDVNNVAVDVNSTLRCEILKKLDPANLMSAEKSAQDVHISHVGAKAVYVQVIRGLQVLKLLMKELEDRANAPNFKPKPVVKLSTDRMYATKLVNETEWRRVKFIRVRGEDQVEVLSVDEGNSLLVSRQNLVSLEDFSSLLSAYPCQASQVRLHKISPLMFNKSMSEKLRRLAPKSDIFFMKVVGNHEKIPVVEIYQRTEKNLLASLNDTLALEPEAISKTDEFSHAKSRLRSSIGARSEFPLKSPTIPGNGEFFDVRVTMSAHPGNFTVQPLNHSKDLDSMMDKLSDVCSTYSGPPLTPGSVKAGNMYAAKYEDGKWYRAYISRVISDTVFAVYFCDYGDYNAVSIDKLQPLQNQFFDLPYQAIKAKLHGVTPKLDDWTVKDSLRFSELTVDKSFVSIVKSSHVDNSFSGEIISLDLIDTSSRDDIYISRMLIEENRAHSME